VPQGSVAIADLKKAITEMCISESSEEPAWRNFEAAWVRDRSPKNFIADQIKGCCLMHAGYGTEGAFLN
jgi:hypothetical protein